ncbi:MAG: alpha/beta hydrolase [Armatimonadetes bacterium]|nr:alpha/beta hydrolase [Armatimonadota bacterium]
MHTVLPLLILLLCLASLAPAAPLPVPRRETFACTLDGSKWPYLVQDPPGPAQGILINLHGHYADETQMMTEGIYEDAFGKLRRECLRRNWAYVCTWYGGNSWMGPVAEAGMVDLVGVLGQRWPGVPVYLQGGSMGGTSVLILALRQPQLFAGVVARCPASDIEAYYDWALARAPQHATLRNITDAIRIHYTADGHDLREELQARSVLQHAERLTMPVQLCHGAADALIPVDWARELAEKLKGLGRRVQYQEIPGGGHDSPVIGVDWAQALDFVSP